MPRSSPDGNRTAAERYLDYAAEKLEEARAELRDDNTRLMAARHTLEAAGDLMRAVTHLLYAR